MRHVFVLVMIALLAPVLAVAQSGQRTSGPQIPERNAALDAMKVTFDDALTHAQDAVVNGLAYRIELATHEGQPVHIVHMLVGDPTHVITLDAKDGSIVGQHDEPYNKHGTVIRIRLAEPNVGLGQAVQLAEADSPAFRAYSSEVIVRGNQIQFEVRLVSKDLVRYVTLTPSGQILNAGPPPTPTKK